HGYEISVANDGWEALKTIRAKAPDLVITDVNMPNMNGLELTRRMRADHRTARIPVIMLSARKQADDVLSGYAEGAAEYVPKAVDLLQKQSDYVVVDAPASFSQHVLAVLDSTDAVVVVTAAHLPSLKATKQALEVLEKLSFPTERTVLVVNRTSAAGVEMDHVARFFNRKPDIVVPYTEACDDAADRGRPLAVLHPDSAASKMIRDLAARIAVAAPAGR